MKKVTTIFLLLFIAGACLAQSNTDQPVFWKPLFVNGEFGAKASYRNQYSLTAGVEDRQQSGLLSGRLLLNTSSYFWTPKFLILDVDGEFNPETSSDDYLVVPDQAEARTLGRLGVSGLFFEQKPISLTLFTHFDEGYSNRENLTNLRTSSRDYGGRLTFANRILPGNIGYKEALSSVTEIPGARVFSFHEKNLSALANKNFGKRDKNEFRYSHEDYLTTQNELTPINVISDDASLLNSLFFDQKQNFRFNSYISALNQTRADNQKRYQVSETFTAKLPKNLDLYTDYTFYKFKWQNTTSNQNTINGRLQHRLYESLVSDIYAEYSDTKHTYYHETIIREGFDVNYQKKLSHRGLFTFNYNYEHQKHTQVSDATLLQIFNEQHVLSDGKIVLLNKAYVTISSIVVTDVTGSLLYQLNLDYIIILRNNYVEIQRIPGGQIVNNGLVLVNYDATQPGSYQYDLNIQNIATSIMFFDRLVEFYFRFKKQDYANLEQTEYLTVDYIQQKFYGIRFEYKVASAGVEYDDYKSTIVPYKMTRYYMAVQGSYHNRISYSLTGNIRNYNMTADSILQEYDDLSGNIAFVINMHSHINFDMAYRNQKGVGIDLKLLTSRIEYVANYRKLYFTIGLDFYKRTYIGEKLNFKGGSLEITRRF